VAADDSKDTARTESPAAEEAAEAKAADADADAAEVAAEAATETARDDAPASREAVSDQATAEEPEAAATEEPKDDAPPTDETVGEKPGADEPEADADTSADESAAGVEDEAKAGPDTEKESGQEADSETPAPVRKRRTRRASAKPKPKKPARAVKKLQPGPLQGTVVDGDGSALELVDLPAGRFGVAADVHTLHLVVRAEQAARRSGTASTRTRGEVAGSTAKLYRQKGTGRARAGSAKSPVRTGGGTVFGPRPRDYSIKVNRKVTRRALAMALSSRADTGSVFVTRGLQLDGPSTQTLDRMLEAMDIAAPVLVITQEEPVVAKSVRNLKYAETAEVADLRTEQVLRARSLVFTEKAFGAMDEA